MPDWKAETRGQLGDAVRELEAVQYRLLGIAARLRRPQEEPARLLEEEEKDERTVTRSVVECVLVDRLTPAIRDLAAARKALREQGRRPAE
ncbi:MAG TPA: hypothetical protein VIW92_16570 [Thermoanaerobaculia bacterium]